MVRMPPASAAGGPSVRGGGCGRSGALGLEAAGRHGLVMAALLPGRKAAPMALSPGDQATGQSRVRQAAFAREIAEARDRGVELELDRSGRAVALLADDELGLAVDRGHLGLPFEMLFAAGPRLLVAQIIFLAEHEQHHVGVLLDRAGFTQVRELRALVVAAFDLARELRERKDRNVELLGQRLEAGGDLGHFLHAVFVGAPGGALQQLDIVDDQQVEPALALEPARARGKLRDREAAGFVDVERQVLQFDRNILDLSRNRLRRCRRGGWCSTKSRCVRR